ncbi:MAG TPA: ATP-dependent DNA helicase RecG [Kofleriaceae bacterium]
MDAELKRRVEALRRPLELAAADRFAGVRTVRGLGHALRAACDRVLAQISAGRAASPITGLDAWRLTLGRWEQLDEQQQAVEVARGMRLLARLPRPAGPPPLPKPTFTLPPLRAAAPPAVRETHGAPAQAPVAAKPVPLVAHQAPLVAQQAPVVAQQAPVVAASGARRRSAKERSEVPAAGGSPEPARDPGKPRRAGDAARTASTAPTARTASTVPTASTASTVPTASTASTVPTASTASTASAARTARTASTAPTASTASTVPTASTARTAPTAPTAPGEAPAGGSPDPARDPGKPRRAGDAARTALMAPGEAPAGGSPESARDPGKPRRAGEAASTASIARDPGKPRRAGDAARSAATAPGAAPAEPPEPVDPLAAPTHSLPGIGPGFAEKLAEKGLVTVEDLVWLVPRRYDDVRGARPLAEVAAIPEGERATFTARVASARMVFARGRRWAEVRLGSVDATQPVAALVRWFNVFAGIDKRMPPGSQVTLSGPVRRRAGRIELANPDILGIELPPEESGGEVRRSAPAILARYPDVAGVPPGRLRSACAAACARVAGCAEDGVPPVIEVAAGLPGLADTLAQLHAPPPDTAPEELAAMNRGDSRWQRRLAFGELFALGVAITLRRRERRADAAVPCPRDPGLAGALAAALPFTLTGAQRRAIDEIAGDVARDVPMNRLLQGDVGAGKTAVAFAAALQAARARRQTAVMAPTELLAEQHAETWRAWARSCGLRLELVTASVPRGIRASTLALAAAGELDVLIGTHALLAEAVGFRALGLVVIDEQHRFGVAQRAKLRDKGDGQGAPHLLVMTATPIPRTLALTAYGDLDVSVLDELPPGRTPVATRVLSGARGVAAAYKLVAERVAAGERAYLVYPKVAPDDPAGDSAGNAGGNADARSWKDATTGAAEVAAALPGARVGLVHGRLDAATRDRVMRAFKTGELDALVATTVIEVGVDVPAATVMVIQDAERFGLAQLHQLRGRVGRGGGASHCLLVTQGQAGEDARRRLDAMVATHDGFVIAEEDLALRGPGELLGPRQAGVPRLRFGDLQQHTELLLEARRHAEAVLDDDPELAKPAHAALRRALARRLARTVYGAEGG